MSCKHEFHEIDIRIPSYPDITEFKGRINIPTYTVKCICLKCSNTYIIDQNKELVNG